MRTRPFLIGINRECQIIKGSFPPDPVTLQRLPDFYFHNSQPYENCFNVLVEEGGVESGREGGAGLQTYLGTRGEKKNQKPTHCPFSLSRQMSERHNSVELESGKQKATLGLCLGVGFRAYNYICLATVQALCNIMNEERSLCCLLEAGYVRLPIPKSMQPPAAVSCLENPGFSGRGQLGGELGDSDQSSRHKPHG